MGNSQKKSSEGVKEGAAKQVEEQNVIAIPQNTNNTSEPQQKPPQSYPGPPANQPARLQAETVKQLWNKLVGNSF